MAPRTRGLAAAARAKAAFNRRGCASLGGALLAAVMFLQPGGGPALAGATTPSPPISARTFVSGMPVIPPPSLFAGTGPVGLAFSRSGRLFVSDAANSGLYVFGPRGSTMPTPLSTGNVQTGLAFGKDDRLFAALYQAGDIDEVDPSTGAFIRQLNPTGTTYPCVIGLAEDPMSGDLFFGQTNSGGVCPGNPVLTRVEDPNSAHPTFVAYTAQPSIYYEGLTFAPDGTLYAVQQGPSDACAVRISGTRAPSPPTITTIACFPNFGEFIGIETIALFPSAGDESNGNESAAHRLPLVYVAGPSGTITEIDQSTTPPTLTPIITLGTRVDGLVTGPDCRLYATQSTGIDRMAIPRESCCHAGLPGGPDRSHDGNRCPEEH